MILFRFLLLVFPVLSYGQVRVQEQVLERDSAFKPVLREVVLQDLLNDQGFDGKYFKIVKGKSEVPISLHESDRSLRLKAATVYFHLTRAREFWVQKLDSKFVQDLGKVTVRLEITQGFSDLAHFTQDSFEPEYNNAVSVPAGAPMAGAPGEPWGPEIWFRPEKRIPIRELAPSGLHTHSELLTRYLEVLGEPIREDVLTQFVRATLQKLFFPEMLKVSYPVIVLGSLGTFAVATALIKEGARIDRLFMKKEYYLDTAMIPEIIQHEFAHLALSDHLELVRSTPVIEGFADYFSTTLSGNPNIATRIRAYSNSAPKKGRNRQVYTQDLERLFFSNSDFVLSVMWLIRDRYPQIADRLIYRASFALTTRHSDIRHDLIRALLDACLIECKEPRRDRLELIQAFEKKGL
jgi:hypothetical protein